MSKTCQECRAKCCTYFCFEIDKPDSYEEFEDVRWYLCHEGVSVHIDEGDWYISIENRCTRLGGDDLCTAYDDRPVICRKYDTAKCDHTGGDYGYAELFTRPEQIEAYARRALGEDAFEAARKKALAKLHPRKARKSKKRKAEDRDRENKAAG